MRRSRSISVIALLIGMMAVLVLMGFGCSSGERFSAPSEPELSQAVADDLAGSWELLGTVHEGGALAAPREPEQWEFHADGTATRTVNGAPSLRTWEVISAGQVLLREVEGEGQWMPRFFTRRSQLHLENVSGEWLVYRRR